jgi:hypothetical protein
LDFLDAESRLTYVVAMGENAVLTRLAAPATAQVRPQSDASGQTAHVYLEARYAAKTWAHDRRVVIKAEVVRLPGREPRDNARFVITNLRQTPRFVSEQVDCARGDIENRIKELHHDRAIGRTSCTRCWANQLRVLLTAAADILRQEVRLQAARTSCARAQVATLRLRLLKLGAHVVASVRRLVIHLSLSTPDSATWQRIALRLGARPGSRPRSAARLAHPDTSWRELLARARVRRLRRARMARRTLRARAQPHGSPRDKLGNLRNPAFTTLQPAS